MSNTDFFPEGYEVPKTWGGNYMKFEDWDNKIRILSKPTLGWRYFTTENKAKRFTMKNKPSNPEDLWEKSNVQHFWAVLVYNYREWQAQILEITQNGIQNAIKDLATDPEWGSPHWYDINIKKSWSWIKTEYSVQPSPQKEFTDQKALSIWEKIDLEALFEWWDPFEYINDKSF